MKRPTENAMSRGARSQSQLPSAMRKSTLVLHAVCGIGWMGTDIALFLLLLNSWKTSSATEALSGYTAVSIIVPSVVPPLSVGVLLTGLILGWGSPWGIVRHWWVFVKLVLSAGMTLLVFTGLLPAVRSIPAITSSMSADMIRNALGPLAIQLMFPPAVSFVLLAVATVLSIFKPKGMPPWSKSKSDRNPAAEYRQA